MTAPARMGFLHGPATDLAILVGPWALFAGATLRFGADQGTAYPIWISQFVLGNTTHVILTFLLLGLRTDVLRATPGQARTVIVGSIATFVASWCVFRGILVAAPAWGDFPMAVAAIFGTHHRISQARGIWSLYNLRGKGLGAPPPGEAERWFQRHYVSIGLLVVMIAWLFVPVTAHATSPLLQAIPSEPALLPSGARWVLAAAWLVYSGAMLVVLARAAGPAGAKLLHLASHGAAVTLAIVMPVWGGIVWGSIHGLEYFFLCGRMLRPGAADPPSGLSRGIVVPVMLLAMAPLFVAGLGQAPFAARALGDATWQKEALVLVNALVMAHYFADAFIYRFRIPDVRKVALARLGFA